MSRFFDANAERYEARFFEFCRAFVDIGDMPYGSLLDDGEDPYLRSKGTCERNTFDINAFFKVI